MTLDGFVIISDCIGDKTVTNIAGAVCGGPFAFQFDHVDPFLFATKSEANAYVKELRKCAKADVRGPLHCVVVHISQLIADVEGTRKHLKFLRKVAAIR